jgi:hypothetical protein
MPSKLQNSRTKQMNQVRPGCGTAAWPLVAEEARHELPGAALLLSTSGSTSSPELVRLNGESVEANTPAIAQYLQLPLSDTALPLSYCYGLGGRRTATSW